MSQAAKDLLAVVKQMTQNGSYKALELVKVQDTDALQELKDAGLVKVDSLGPGWDLQVFPR